jgi:hypothetical protein
MVSATLVNPRRRSVRRSRRVSRARTRRSRTRTIRGPVTLKGTWSKAILKENARRRRRVRRAEENARRRRARRYAVVRVEENARRRRARRYVANPRVRGGDITDLLMLKGISYKGNWLKGIGYGVLGLVDTGITGLVVDLAMSKTPVLQRSIVRLIAKGVVGTVLSYGIGAITKDKQVAKYHQVGVYASLVLDAIGTVLIASATSGKGLTGNEAKILGEVAEVGALPNLKNPLDIVKSVFGVKGLEVGLNLQKLRDALMSGTALTVMGNAKSGEVAIGLENKPLISGEATRMGKVIGMLGAGNLGEDITVEKGTKA